MAESFPPNQLRLFPLQTQIDQYIDLIRTQVNNTIAKLQEKLPGAMKRSKTE